MSGDATSTESCVRRDTVAVADLSRSARAASIVSGRTGVPAFESETT